MVGIRDAHVEKQTPERKKNMLRKIRCLSFDSAAIPPGYPSETNVVRRLKNIQLHLLLNFDSYVYEETNR